MDNQNNHGNLAELMAASLVNTANAMGKAVANALSPLLTKYEVYEVLKDFINSDAEYLEAGYLKEFDTTTKFFETLLEHGFIKKFEKVDFDVIVTSKLAGVEIADRDYTEGDKKHFTWKEAKAISDKLEKETGWRLPTRKEWSLICEEFGCNKNGELSGSLLEEKLKLEPNGWKDYDGPLYNSGSYGDWWSSTANDTANRYYLSYNTSSGLYSGNSVNRDFGLSVRLVRDVEGRK